VETNIRKHSGSKYLRTILPAIDKDEDGSKWYPTIIDVYCILDAFPCSAPVGHAVKKLLCMGIRGKGNALQDLKEARDAITRAIQLEEQKGEQKENVGKKNVIVSAGSIPKFPEDVKPESIYSPEELARMRKEK
jgi:hypothetical protein